MSDNPYIYDHFGHISRVIERINSKKLTDFQVVPINDPMTGYTSLYLLIYREPHA